MKWCIFLVLVIFSTLSKAENICELSESDKMYFDLTDSLSFSDSDFSPENVLITLSRLKAYYSGQKVDYFNHQNAVNILHGGFLQDALKATKEVVDKTEYDKRVKDWEMIRYEHETNYLKAKFEYCNFQKNTRSIYW